MKFNRNGVQVGNSIEDPSDDVIKDTLSLWNCTPEDAITYGGDLTRAALSAMTLKNDRKYVIVDTKIHMLMPGFGPGIFGWHTDGVPRGEDLNPASKGAPNIHAQEQMEDRAPRYHLLVTGDICPTRFVSTRNVEFDVPAEPTHDLYKLLSHEVNSKIGTFDTFDTRPSEVVTWDWWNVHCVQRARGYGWRYLIRVTETDFIQPQTDLRQIIRKQNQVYIPETFGW